jgi:hypothetical protein
VNLVLTKYTDLSVNIQFEPESQWNIYGISLPLSNSVGVTDSTKYTIVIPKCAMTLKMQLAKMQEDLHHNAFSEYSLDNPFKILQNRFLIDKQKEKICHICKNG